MNAKRCLLSALLVAGVAASGLNAQESARFQFKRGQVLQYLVEQTTKVADAGNGDKSEFSSRSNVTKQWQVLEVDANGVATLQLSFTRMVLENQLASGETWRFDSENVEQSHPALRESMSGMVRRPMAILRVDALGQVLEVVSTAQGQASRYQSELPFTIPLPGTPLKTGSAWKRDYRIVLDPPLGTGEKYAAEQRYEVKRVNQGQMVIAFATTIKDVPPNPNDRLPLMQMQPQGEVTFDSNIGLVTAARFTSTGVIEGHQGDGSRYEFRSEYQEKLVNTGRDR